jgi:hypothetical protein
MQFICSLNAIESKYILLCNSVPLLTLLYPCSSSCLLYGGVLEVLSFSSVLAEGTYILVGNQSKRYPFVFAFKNKCLKTFHG